MKNIFLLINLVWLCCLANATFHENRILFNYYMFQRAVNGSITNFSYNPLSPNAPANWPQFAPDCGGTSQSPINLHILKSVKINQQLGQISATKWAEKPTMVTVINNGYTVRFIFSYADDGQPLILLNGAIYELVEIHFHFGLDRRSGTEHYINGRAYAMESHAVFFNQRYETPEIALTQPDGLAVIGRLYEEVNLRESINIDFGFLRYVQNPSATIILNGVFDVFSLEDVMGPLNLPYFMYPGSLTTPGCNEVVTWCVGAKVLRISSTNLLQFRLLLGVEGLMAPNVRPLQEINGRLIYYSKG